MFYTEDVGFLKELTYLYLNKDQDNYFLPYAIKTLLEKKEQEFVGLFLSENIDFLLSKNFFTEAELIKQLIKSNSEDGFRKLKQVILSADKDNLISDDYYYNTGWANYTNPKSIDDLIDIAEYYLSLDEPKVIFRGWFSPIRIAMEALVSIAKNSNIETSYAILDKWKSMKINQTDEKKDPAFFYHNFLNDINNVIYRHKSKPYPLREAKILVDNYQDIFYD